MLRPMSSSSLRRLRRESRMKRQKWLKHKIIRALKKMNLVGLREALQPGIFWMERLMWTASFVFFLAATGYTTALIVMEHWENPISHNFHEDEPIFNVPFPGITIAGTTIFTNDAVGESEALFDNFFDLPDGVQSFESEGLEWDWEIVNILIFFIDHFCGLANSFATRANILNNNFENWKLTDEQNFLSKTPVPVYDNPHLKGVKENVIPFLKKKTLDCERILAACYWEGDNQNCVDIFLPVQTDVGIGCSFNRVPDKILRPRQGLLSFLHNPNYTVEEFNQWKNYNMDSGLKGFQNVTYPRAQHTAGKLTGLSFMLLFDNNTKGMACPVVDSSGFLLGVHSPFEQPRLMRSGVTIPRSHEVFVNVKAEITIADKDIGILSFEKRKCYFQDENPLSDFTVYTLANCHQECLGKWITNRCNCTLLTFSGGQNEKLCGPPDKKCVWKETDFLEKTGYDQLCETPRCYAACTEVKYNSDASYLPYHKHDIFDLAKINLSKYAVTSIVHVTQASNSIPKRERKMRFSFSTLFGVLGGSWGVTFEFSLLTILNIIAGLIVLVMPECPELDQLRDEEGTFNDSACSNPQNRGNFHSSVVASGVHAIADVECSSDPVQYSFEEYETSEIHPSDTITGENEIRNRNHNGVLADKDVSRALNGQGSHCKNIALHNEDVDIEELEFSESVQGAAGETSQSKAEPFPSDLNSGNSRIKEPESINCGDIAGPSSYWIDLEEKKKHFELREDILQLDKDLDQLLEETKFVKTD